MYKYTVNDHYERIAAEIWEASKTDDWNTFTKCLDRLKALKITSGIRAEYAKVALAGLSSVSDFDGNTFEETARQAFKLADAMLAEEEKSR